MGGKQAIAPLYGKRDQDLAGYHVTKKRSTGKTCGSPANGLRNGDHFTRGEPPGETTHRSLWRLALVLHKDHGRLEDRTGNVESRP